jgi:hypothetical protein
MPLSLHDIAAPALIGGLDMLKSALAKAVSHAEAKAVDPSTLLEAQLFPDMFSFKRQILTATDTARRGMDRLVGKEPSSVADDETTFAELIARVDATIAHVQQYDAAALASAESRELTIPIGPTETLDFTGRAFLMSFMLPNFMFHVVTAYDILRHQGVVLGKRDFLAPFIAAGAPK